LTFTPNKEKQVSDLPIKATLKAGAGYDAPWLTVDAHDPADLELKLTAIATGGAPQALVEAANALKAANNAAPLLSNGGAPAQPAQQSAPPPQQNGGWGTPSQPASPPPAQQQQQQQAAPAAATHPEGWACHCGSLLQYKIVNRRLDGKQFKFWVCPNQRSKDDGHRSEFA